MVEPILVIACGALAHEIVRLKQLNGWNHLTLQCLAADLHNRPEQIPAKLKALIERYRDQYSHIFVAYADCGTGGAIDRILAEEGIERLVGAHCYATYAGQEAFTALAEQELGSFYLTDFLVRHFTRLVIQGLKLDQHPELREMIFGHYRRVVYLSQYPDTDLLAKAERAAQYLALDFVHIHTGYGELAHSLHHQISIPIVKG